MPPPSIDGHASHYMNDRRLIREVIEWDVGSWKRALPLWERWAGDLTGARVLDIGSRNGGLSLYFALRGCKVVCSDRNGPPEKAMTLHRKHGVCQNMCYRTIDATQIDCPDGEFDVVCFKSVLGGIAGGDNLQRAGRAIGEMLRVLRPGGIILFAENLRASFLHAYLRNHCVRWGSTWRYLTVDELRELFAGFADLRLSCYGFLAAFGRSERQRALLHAVDVLIGPLVPQRSRYVAFGCATK